MKRCDIIIPVWNEPESTRECITRIKKYTRYPYKVIVIDNGSANPAKEYLENLKNEFNEYFLIRNNKNMGFVKAVNQGIKASRADYTCILNNDAYATEGWLKNLIETTEKSLENIGLTNPTSNIFGKASCDGRKYEYQELDFCRGFCMLVKKEVIEKIGLFDEIFGMGYFEEKDFSMRAKEAGYISVRAKTSFVFHKDKLSFDKLKERDEIFKRNEDTYNKRWGKAQNIAFVPRKEKGLENRKEMIYKLLDKGHKIHIFFRKGNPITTLKDHINIKYFPIGDFGFGYTALFKLWERRRKKKVELIVCEDKLDWDFFERFKFLHKARIVNSPAQRRKHG